jgi:hypothetical protein
MTKAESIRDVIAFPKTQRAQCLLTGRAEPLVDEKQLRELHIRLRNAGAMSPHSHLPPASEMPTRGCAWPPTTSTRACAAWARASGWRSTTWAWASRRWTPTWCSCRRCGCSPREARHFDRTWFGWPDEGQADFLAPEGYEVAYRTNAITRHGEHGNALLSRWPLGDVGHHDVSTTASSSVACCMCRCYGRARRCMRWWRTWG